MAHHLVVDEITRRYGPGDSNQTTVRGKFDEKTGKNSNNVGAPKSVTLGYAFYQMTALGSIVLPNARLMDLGYNILIAIQSSAFLMTLFRKGIIRWYTHVFWYSVALLMSWTAMYMAIPGIWFWIKVAIVFQLRTGYRMGKYTVWTLFFLVSLPIVENTLFAEIESYKATMIPTDFFSMQKFGFQPKASF